MPVFLDQIKDPRTRQRVADALEAAGDLRQKIAKECPKPKRRIRQSHKPLMNKLEQEYHDTFLRGHQVHIQSIRFKLANGIWYKPDFVSAYGRKCIEVKGPHAFRGGFENLKVAASQYPWIKWVLVWKEDGQWQEQVILP